MAEFSYSILSIKILSLNGNIGGIKKHPDQTTKYEKSNMWNNFSNVVEDKQKNIL